VIDCSDWTIIVVEDMYDDQQVVSRLLEYYHITVYIAEDGNACLRLLQEIQPTLVITDLAMPHLDGWQTLSAIRANPQTAHVPVVAVTAYHAADVAENALHVGFDAYFPKPLNPQTFVERLAAIINVAH